MSDFSLKAVFGLDATGMKATLSELDDRVGKFADKWVKLGAAAGAAAFVALGKNAIQLAGQLSDTAQNIGVNVESLQALEAQAKRNGVSEEQLTKALEKTKAAVIGAAEGDKTATKALEKLHLTASDLLKLPLDRQFEAIAKAVAKAKDENTAFSAVTDILGEKVGPKLMGSLKELGDVGLPGVTKAAKEAGQVMSAETIVALDRAGDAIDDFKKRMTVAVGNIIVNFRTKEGIELMGLQFMKVLGEFGGGFLDAISEGAQFVYVALKGSFLGAVNFFQDSMVDVVKGIAGLMNKLLPEKFEINVGNLDQFKSDGKTVADEITDALNNTSPTTFKKDFGAFWDSKVADMRVAVDAVNKADLKPAADNLRAAGKAVKGHVEEGAKAIEDAGPKVAKPIKDAAKEIVEIFGGITRVGKNYIDQSTASLQGVVGNLTKQLNEVSPNTGMLMRNATMSTDYGAYATAQVIRDELAKINQELALRAQVQGVASTLGEGAARSQFGDTLTDRALRDMQDSATQTAKGIDQLNTTVRAIGSRLGITPIG